MTAFLVLGVLGLGVIAVALVVGDLHGGALELATGGWVSTELVGSFVAALGLGGAAALGAGAPTGLAVVVGVVAGVVFGAVAAAFTRLVRGGGTDGTPSADDAVGREGTVVSDIPVGGFGTVRVRLGGHTVRFNARADLPLDAGSVVHVTSVLSPTAITVAPTWTAQPPAVG